MQIKQLLWFDNRAEFLEWLKGSDLAISTAELESNEAKKYKLIVQMNAIDTYEKFVNYFACDALQTLIWSGQDPKSKEPQMQVMPLFIGSDKYIPNEDDSDSDSSCIESSD